MTRYVLAVGNPFDGVFLVGPFDSMGEGALHAREMKYSVWTVVAMEAPDQDLLTRTRNEQRAYCWAPDPTEG